MSAALGYDGLDTNAVLLRPRRLGDGEANNVVLSLSVKVLQDLCICVCAWVV